jgi:hypothetical protein
MLIIPLRHGKRRHGKRQHRGNSNDPQQHENSWFFQSRKTAHSRHYQTEQRHVRRRRKPAATHSEARR